MVKKFNRKAHKEKLLYALQYLIWFQNPPPLKRNFNALYGLKKPPPLKRNFHDLYVYKNYPQLLYALQSLIWFQNTPTIKTQLTYMFTKFNDVPTTPHSPRDAFAETYPQVERVSLCTSHPSKPNHELVSPSYNSHTPLFEAQFSRFDQ